MEEIKEKQQDEEYQRKLVVKWKIWIGIIIILFVSLPAIYRVIFPEKEIVYKRMKKYLRAKYGEEFVILGLHKASQDGDIWYETYAIYPERYIGTLKEFDKYYQSSIVTTDETFREFDDGYTNTLVSQSANEFFRPKLVELFGKNVVPALILGGSPKYTDFEREMERRRKYYKKREAEGLEEIETFAITKGAIYIYGRVENEEDKEEYRKKVYEFIQYMKETDNFDYVNLNIQIIDERELVDGIERIYSNLSSELDRMTFRKERKKYYQEFNQKFAEMTQKEIQYKLSMLDLGDMAKETTGTMLYLKLYSPKQIISNNWDDEIKEYNNLNEMEFTWEAW